MIKTMNNHVFKGHRTLLGSRFVTYGELELPTREDIFKISDYGFDWGNGGSASVQLAFSMLYQVTKDKKLSEEHATRYATNIISTFNTRDWILSANDVLVWVKENCPKEEAKEQQMTMKKLQPLKSHTKKRDRPKTNVVKEICKELNITQKNLAEILEVPEGTVSSWAVKNEIPRLGKKAIEFYMINVKNQKILDSYKSFKELLEAS